MANHSKNPSDGAAGPQAIAAERLFDGEALHGPSIVVAENGRIAAVLAGREAPAGLTATALPESAVLAPGFIDLQVNGGDGILLNDRPDAAGVARIAAAHRRFGTTALLPTLITDGRERMAALLASAPEALGVPGVLGFHLEGPFINPVRKGVHSAEHIRLLEEPDLQLLLGFAACGRSLVTLAPECVPDSAIRALAAAGLTLSAGHSDATYAQVRAAIGAGLRGVTHLYNAMSPLMGRAPGVVGAALAHDDLHAGIICDGLHVDPASVRAAWRAMGPARLFIVSDAMATVGSDARGFSLHGRWVGFDTDGVLKDASGTLGGAHITMAESVGNAVRLAGLPLADALRMATSTPADFIGVGDRIGRIRPGLQADLVGYEDGAVSHVWQAGVAQPVAA